jgi:ABC-2 type transport system ATP-binding protein
VLEIDHLTKRYGDLVALDGASFEVAQGRIAGFLGPNGAGKTTTMRAILGLVHPDGGEIRWKGAALGAAERARFGYMPEERGLYPKMKVREQLVYFAELSGLSGAGAKEAADRWLAEVGLQDRATAKVEELSHGNQQRVQLGAALVHDPELVVLDEPFSGLDPLGVASLAELLARTAAAGTAVLFSSHQLDLVEDVCQDVVIIDHGRIVAAGVVDELKAAAPVRVLRVEVDGKPWAPALRGDVVTGSHDGHDGQDGQDGQGRLLVDASVDLETILAQANRAGTVTTFTYEPPSLADLFLAAVSKGERRP